MKIRDFRIDIVRENNESCGIITHTVAKKAKKKKGGLKMSSALEKGLPSETQEKIRQLTNSYLDELKQLLKDL